MFDFCAGTLSTAVTCMALNRVSCSVEKDADCFHLAQLRMKGSLSLVVLLNQKMFLYDSCDGLLRRWMEDIENKDSLEPGRIISSEDMKKAMTRYHRQHVN